MRKKREESSFINPKGTSFTFVSLSAITHFEQSDLHSLHRYWKVAWILLHKPKRWCMQPLLDNTLRKRFPSHCRNWWFSWFVESSWWNRRLRFPILDLLIEPIEGRIWKRDLHYRSRWCNIPRRKMESEMDKRRSRSRCYALLLSFRVNERVTSKSTLIYQYGIESSMPSLCTECLCLYHSFF